MHALDFTTGNAGIAITYDGDTPWHGFGTRVPKDAPLEEWRIAAGLNWDVIERAVYYSKQEPVSTGDDFDLRKIPTQIQNRKVLLRSDSQEPLSIVGDKYHVVQPGEVLAFYEELVKANGFTMETAGSLMDGRRIWALARTGKETRLFGQDRVDGFVLLATSYDGTMATTCQHTSVRVVCNNTLEWATESANGAYKVAHNKEFDAEEAKGVLGLTEGAWEKYEQDMNKLASTTVDLETAVAFFTKVLGKDAFVFDEDGKPDYSPTMHKMFAAYEGGPGAQLRSANHTAWGLVNAVTFHQDHMTRSNKSGSRLNSSWFGAGSARKKQALKVGMELVAA